eukprot:g2256.t1
MSSGLNDHSTCAQQNYRSKAEKTGLSVGTGRGHLTTKFVSAKKEKQLAGKAPATSRMLRKRKQNKKISLIRAVAAEVCGLSPYEKRLLEVLKTGGAGADKKIYKMAKKRLGTHRRAIIKRKNIKDYAQELARAAMK